MLILLIFYAKLQCLLRSQPLPLCETLNTFQLEKTQEMEFWFHWALQGVWGSAGGCFFLLLPFDSGKPPHDLQTMLQSLPLCCVQHLGAGPGMGRTENATAPAGSRIDAGYSSGKVTLDPSECLSCAARAELEVLCFSSLCGIRICVLHRCLC